MCFASVERATLVTVTVTVTRMRDAHVTQQRVQAEARAATD